MVVIQDLLNCKKIGDLLLEEPKKGKALLVADVFFVELVPLGNIGNPKNEIYYFKGIVMLFYIQILKIVANIKVPEIIVHSKHIKHKSKNLSRNFSRRVPLGGAKKKPSLKNQFQGAFLTFSKRELPK
jgi:hypothetical protein